MKTFTSSPRTKRLHLFGWSRDVTSNDYIILISNRQENMNAENMNVALIKIPQHPPIKKIVYCDKCGFYSIILANIVI
jgi:hypothetical protein